MTNRQRMCGAPSVPRLVVVTRQDPPPTGAPFMLLRVQAGERRKMARLKCLAFAVAAAALGPTAGQAAVATSFPHRDRTWLALLALGIHPTAAAFAPRAAPVCVAGVGLAGMGSPGRSHTPHRHVHAQRGPAHGAAACTHAQAKRPCARVCKCRACVRESTCAECKHHTTSGCCVCTVPRAVYFDKSDILEPTPNCSAAAPGGGDAGCVDNLP